MCTCEVEAQDMAALVRGDRFLTSSCPCPSPPEYVCAGERAGSTAGRVPSPDERYQVVRQAGGGEREVLA